MAPEETKDSEEQEGRRSRTNNVRVPTQSFDTSKCLKEPLPPTERTDLKEGTGRQSPRDIEMLTVPGINRPLRREFDPCKNTTGSVPTYLLTQAPTRNPRHPLFATTILTPEVR